MHRVALAVATALTATALAATALTAASGARAALRPSEAARLQSAARVVQEIRQDIAAAAWERARCVAVVPELRKAAFIIGGEYGRGIMSCRAGEGWSAPLFMQLAKGSWGFQAGAQQVDLVLLVTNESGVQKLLQDKVTLGADASVAAGPVGAQGSVATDAALKAEILSYSRAQGLFAGVDLSGGILRPDEEANREAYGSGASARTILASRDISAPPEAASFLRALGPSAVRSERSHTAAVDSETGRPTQPRASEGTAPAAGPAARSGQTEPRPATRSMTDDDLRARLVDIQQILDRMLSETTPPPVGTSGTGAPGSASGSAIVVDRARLLQLRQQLSALIAALNKS